MPPMAIHTAQRTHTALVLTRIRRPATMAMLEPVTQIDICAAVSVGDVEEILRTGQDPPAEVWNRWREGNLDIKPDLRKADLFGAVLKAANLDLALLTRTDLNKGNLSMVETGKRSIGQSGQQ
jgi:hypothetical protein